MPVPSIEICDNGVTRAAALGLSPNPPTLRTVKLGRVRTAARPSALRFGCYLNRAKAPASPPASVDYSAKARAALAQMLGNDQYGDCVIAGKTHAVGVWTGNDGATPVVGSTSEAISEYRRLCGPGDNGCVITNVLDAMKSSGLSVAGVRRKIDGYVSVDVTNRPEVQIACLVFGGLSLGLNLPRSWTGLAAHNGFVWDDPGAFIPAGGHDVYAVGYDASGVQVSTWGMIGTITWRAFSNPNIVEECYAILSPEWYGNDMLAPNGIDASSLKSDLAKLNSGTLPDWQPSDPPPPEPSPSPGVRAVTLTGTLDEAGNLSLTGKAVSLS